MVGAAGKVKRPSRLRAFIERKRQARLARIPKTLDTSGHISEEQKSDFDLDAKVCGL